MNKRKVIFIIVAVLWTGFIFYNSTNSAEVSMSFSRIFASFFGRFLDFFTIKYDADVLTLIVRKSAHVFEFFMQAVLIDFAFADARRKFAGFYVAVLFTGLLTAVIDEFIQLYSLGRGSSVADVLIDFGGVILGLTVFGIIRALSRRRKKYKYY